MTSQNPRGRNPRQKSNRRTDRGGDRGTGFRQGGRQGGRSNGVNARYGEQGGATRRGVSSATSGLGGDQIEGRRAVLELLRAGKRRVREVLVSEAITDAAFLEELEELAEEFHTPIRYVPWARIDQQKRSDAPQGVIAKAAPLKEYTLEDLLKVENPFLLVLDEITDPHNIGALLRTAECAGVTGVVLGRHRSAHVTPVVAKASAGAVEHVPIAVVPGIPSALAELKAKNVWTVGLDPEGESLIYDVAVADQPIAVVLGSEGSGIGRLTADRCDLLCRIDQYGQVASLNVSAAGAIALFAIARHRN